MKKGQEKEEAVTATTSKLKFAKVASDKAEFFQFSKKDTVFIGKFLRIRPESDNLTGIDFEQINPDTLASEGVKTLPSYHNLIQFFGAKKEDATVVYSITLIEEKKLASGQSVFLFEIGSAVIEADEIVETEA